MTTEEQRQRERKRWHRRYADPEFRKREAERSKIRMAKWLADDKTREHYNANRREYYRKNREKILEYKRRWYRQRKAQGNSSPITEFRKLADRAEKIKSIREAQKRQQEEDA